MKLNEILTEEQNRLVANIIVDLENKDKEIKKLNNIINNATEYLKEHKPVCSTANMLNILLGDDTHE